MNNYSVWAGIYIAIGRKDLRECIKWVIRISHIAGSLLHNFILFTVWLIAISIGKKIKAACFVRMWYKFELS